MSVLLGEVNLCLVSEHDSPQGPHTHSGGDPSQPHHEWDKLTSSMDTTSEIIPYPIISLLLL